jgi:hypothetical protein
MPVGKTLTAVIGFLQLMALNHGTHGTINDENLLLE